jgi:hypothetical protein
MATLRLKCGDDETVRFTITDADGAAINLTGGSIKFKIAKSDNVTDANATYIGTYTSFTDAANGIHDETIPDSTTGAWTPNNERYQARFIDSSGIVVSEDIDNIILEGNLIDNE